MMELEGARLRARGLLGGCGGRIGALTLTEQVAGVRPAGCLSSRSLGDPVCKMGTAQRSLSGLLWGERKGDRQAGRACG